MPYLFTPPLRRNPVVMHGRALIYSYDVASTVWHDTGGWHSQETPAGETLLAADVVFHGTPQIVSDETAAELIAAGIGDCTLLEP